MAVTRLNVESPSPVHVGLSVDKRPVDPGPGAWFFCSDTGYVERFDGANWRLVLQNAGIESLLREILAEQRALREAINMLAAVFN